MKNANLAAVRVAVAAVLACPFPAIAQEPPPPQAPEESEPAPEVVGLEEVIVTSQ